MAAGMTMLIPHILRAADENALTAEAFAARDPFLQHRTQRDDDILATARKSSPPRRTDSKRKPSVRS
jgi:hypothetical protein